MGTERKQAIDDCINKIKSLIRPHCHDHTPYRGACVTCGQIHNADELPDPNTVLKELEKLK